jgi:hypothetical protein
MDQRDWQGMVRLQLVRDGKTNVEQTQPCRVPALGRQVLQFTIPVPSQRGRYQWIAELIEPGKPTVRSLRDFAVFGKGGFAR